MKSRYTVWAREPYTQNPDAIFKPVSNHTSYARALKAGMKQYDQKHPFHLKDNYTGKVVATGLPALGYLKEFTDGKWNYNPS